MTSIVEQIIYYLFKFIGLFPQKNLVYFESFHGKQFSDNPRAIYQFMKENYPDYRLVWGVTKGYEEMFKTLHVPYVKRFSLKWFFIMPRAKTWVINTRTPLWLSKSKHTTYLQTWHGTPLKKLGCDIEDVKIPGYTQESYAAEFSKESARWDYLIAPNEYSQKIFKHAFNYQGEMLEYGYPRNDLLYPNQDNETRIRDIKRRLKIPFNVPIVLYAPTWRENDQASGKMYDFKTSFPYDRFDSFQDKIFVLVRTHYLVSETINFSEYDNVMDVSTGIDMNELLLISDLLITDYSSCMFDYSLTDKPIIYYVPDKDMYQNELRGFYLDFEKWMPGPMVTHPSVLLRMLLKFVHFPDSVKTVNYEEFKQLFTSRETGHNAQLIVERVIVDEKMKEG
ncbi:CDP-glycerol glycerophosphotransferase family protein [Vagococcus vulneris]|uniref:CDP-glycerol--poly(Glycerophosphate) glycerophosphotransferase n=1 Tax=Vagococcus vulneris TaxID=1977869 RepID=A0A429ZZU2_9ENTE|nr:CDP-glycerol glycerophosphotransferase family protein [Vagococcus vulneris]RST99561.1 hypothetical protein CBF37_04335 [Vagococcus vulneris]